MGNVVKFEKPVARCRASKPRVSEEQKEMCAGAIATIVQSHLGRISEQDLVDVLAMACYRLGVTPPPGVAS